MINQSVYSSLFTLSNNDIVKETMINIVFTLEEVLMASSTSNAIIGEIYPIAVKVEPADEAYSSFSIDIEKTYAVIKDSSGNIIETKGQIVLDPDTNTVIFGWDTTDYTTGQYIITLWVTIVYNGFSYKIASESVTKSLRQDSVLTT